MFKWKISTDSLCNVCKVEEDYDHFIMSYKYLDMFTQFKEYKVPDDQKTDDFNIGLVITNMSQSNVYQTEAEKYTLKLQYF
jgi:hypothetical protein